MEPTKEVVMKKGKKPRSPTRFPQRMPTYVVAFAVQETLDDNQKLQLISSKRSSGNSTPSIKSCSPTESINSAKTFTIFPTEKISSVIDITTVNEVKIDIKDENQCGDVMENKPLQIGSYSVIDNRTADEQPKIIFNAPKHIKRCKDSNRFPRKKPRKSKRVITFKNTHFKYKNSKNCITRRLEKYYEKTKLNTSNTEQIQQQIFSNVLSKVVSRSRVLKKVLAKENLLADSDHYSLTDGVFEYDDNSINSSPSTIKKSFTSNISQNTLMRKDSSSSSRNDDFSSIKTANSILHVTSDNKISYQLDVINIALAVPYNASNPCDDSAKSDNNKLIQKVNLTSSETFLHNNTTELTSKPSSTLEPKNYVINYDELSPANQRDPSNENIARGRNSFAGVHSEEGTFVIAWTSSEFNKSSVHSDCTLTFNSETKIQTDLPSSSSTNDELSNYNSEKPTLEDKVKNLGYYPMQAPSIGYTENYGSEMNDVLVTDTIVNSLPLTSQRISGDLPAKENSVLRKPVEMSNMNYLQNNISLPNDLAIKAKLKEVEEERTNADNARNTYPTDMVEMWERLTLLLDLAVKRLEDKLADRIVKDIRASLNIFNQPDPTIQIQRTETVVAPVNCERPIPVMLNKEIFVLEEHLKKDVDICVQCDLVQKHVIDRLMLKLSVEGPKPIPPLEEALKVLEPPKIVEDYVEILKPREAQEIDSASVEIGKGDTVTVSTATKDLSTISGFGRFKLIFSGPMAFLRENMVVLTSVPTFFIVLFCLYGVLVIIMKPW